MGILQSDAHSVMSLPSVTEQMEMASPALICIMIASVLVLVMASVLGAFFPACLVCSLLSGTSTPWCEAATNLSPRSLLSLCPCLSFTPHRSLSHDQHCCTCPRAAQGAGPSGVWQLQSLGTHYYQYTSSGAFLCWLCTGWSSVKTQHSSLCPLLDTHTIQVYAWYTVVSLFFMRLNVLMHALAAT